MPLSIVGTKSNDSFVLLFENSEEPMCPHTKHITRIAGYTFIFCKESRNPIAIYAGEEVKSEEDLTELVGALAEKFGLVSGAIESPFFTKLGEAILNVESVSFEDVDSED